jgi:hypothetical protein
MPKIQVDTKWVHIIFVTECNVSHKMKKNTSTQRRWLACF